jgi:GNAT superfamily N-acetyltransferase
MNRGAILALERIGDLAYPAETVDVLDGWLLRMSGDLGRRVNSVAPLEAGTLPLDEKIDQAEAWYRDRGRVPMFKLTDAAEPPQLDASLAGRGYREDAAVVVMSRPVTGQHSTPGDVLLRSTPEHAWREALQAFSGKSAERVTALPDLIGRARGPAAYASISGREGVLGVSVGVVVEEHLGLFEVFVAPGHRRRGVGRRMMEAVLAWGAARAATTAFLQVEEGNRAALAFYDALGFSDSHRYWYRVTG